MWNFIIPAVAALAGSALSKSGQDNANQTNMNLSEQQMQFQENMRKTQYQTAVWDMKQAGLNPMLSVSQGGAGMQSGSAARVENSVGAGVASGAQAMATMQGIQQMALSKAQTQQVHAETERIKSITLDQDLNNSLALADLRERRARGVHEEDKIPGTRIGNRIKQLDLERQHTTFHEDVKRRKAESLMAELGLEESKAGADFWRNMDSAPKYIQMLLHILGGANSARSAIGR